MRLLLLRHGQTASNVIGALDTAVPGAPLTVLGLAQAKAVPIALADYAVDALYASELTRTQQTAAPLAADRGLEIPVLAGLNEITAGELEMRSDKHSEGLYVATAFAWARGDLDLRMPGGENGHEFFERYDAAIAEIRATAGSSVVAVSHGAAIRVWVAARCETVDGGFAGTHQLDNTGSVTLEWRGSGRWRMLDWHSAPIGGERLSDRSARDPTGEKTEAV